MKYICIEGTEGCYKTTNTDALVTYLGATGAAVLQTKEPGTKILPITMELRKLMLSNEHDSSLTVAARELISQAIRSIHLEKLVLPAFEDYDYIIQDRGILSGLAYGEACGNKLDDLYMLTKYIMGPHMIEELAPAWNIYDLIIFLKRDAAEGLATATSAKQEFDEGDAMEAKGITFMQQVEANFMKHIDNLDNVVIIDVAGKTTEQIQQEILRAIELC